MSNAVEAGEAAHLKSRIFVAKKGTFFENIEEALGCITLFLLVKPNYVSPSYLSAHLGS